LPRPHRRDLAVPVSWTWADDHHDHPTMASSTIQPPCLQCLLGSKCAPRRASMWQNLLALGFFVQYLHQLHQLHLQLELQHVTTIINYHWGDSNNSLRHPLAALSPRNHPRSLVPHGSWVCPNMVVIHGYTLYIPIPEIRVQELGLPGHSKISKPQSSSSPSNIAI
jgi:hypothetical protein